MKENSSAAPMFNYVASGVDCLLSPSPRTALIFEIIHVRKASCCD